MDRPTWTICLRECLQGVAQTHCPDGGHRVHRRRDLYGGDEAVAQLPLAHAGSGAAVAGGEDVAGVDHLRPSRRSSDIHAQSPVRRRSPLTRGNISAPPGVVESTAPTTTEELFRSSLAKSAAPPPEAQSSAAIVTYRRASDWASDSCALAPAWAYSVAASGPWRLVSRDSRGGCVDQPFGTN